jgi:hypothetical protein
MMTIMQQGQEDWFITWQQSIKHQTYPAKPDIIKEESLMVLQQAFSLLIGTYICTILLISLTAILSQLTLARKGPANISTMNLMEVMLMSLRLSTREQFVLSKKLAYNNKSGNVI